MYNNLKMATLLARLAYKRDFRIKQELAYNGLNCLGIEEVDNVKSPFNDTKHFDLKFYVADDIETNIRYFVIRGTNGTFEEWLHNLMFWKKKKSELGKIHYGFSLEAMSILPNIIKYKDTNKIQIIIGHSKGSALAQILAPEIEADLAIGVATPFFSDKNYKNEMSSLKTKYVDVIHSADLVPLITYPLFTPMGDVYYIDRKGNLIKNPSLIRSIADSFLTLLTFWYGRGQKLHDIVIFHCYENYENYFKVDHRKGRV